MSRRRWQLGAAILALVILALIALVGLGGAASDKRATLTITVSGHGTIFIPASGHRCAQRCRERVPVGSSVVLNARAAAGSRLVWWGGGCVARRRCVIRVSRARTIGARFVQNGVLTSWNPYYHCTPVLTTLPSILGSSQSPLHGATEAGGGLQPHLRGPEDQHLLNPPCTVGGTATFVEIHNVIVAGAPEHSGDGDEVVNMSDPNRPDISSGYMKTLHTEIDHQLILHNVAPPIQPKQGTHVDIQGFVFWDTAHTTASFHSFSGWEIHTLTAWRPAARQ